MLTFQSPNDLESWDWDDSPSEIVIGGKREPETVQDHISAYRESLQEAKAKRQMSLSGQREDEGEEEEEPEPDLFADMTPTVIKQKKLFVGPTGSDTSSKGSGARRKSSSRLGVRDDLTDPILSMVSSTFQELNCI